MLFIFDKDMTQDQQRLWIKEKLEWLRSKQRREYAHLARRAHSSVRTPTDEVYTNDQPQLLDLIQMLEGFLQELQTGGEPQ